MLFKNKNGLRYLSLTLGCLIGGYVNIRFAALPVPEVIQYCSGMLTGIFACWLILDK